MKKKISHSVTNILDRYRTGSGSGSESKHWLLAEGGFFWAGAGAELH